MDSVKLLEGLLRAYSPSRLEEGAVSYLAGQMERLGFQVSVDESGSVTGVLGSGPREIVLLGHIDTVPGDIHVRKEGDLLYGRGAVDAKGPLAAFTAAAAQAGAKPGWRVVVIGATGEESDSRGAFYIRDKHRPDFCIIGEPSKWENVTLGYKGSAWFEFTVQRSLAHTAGQAESACDAAIRYWDGAQRQISQYNEGRRGAFDTITASLRSMKSDTDGFNETAQLEFNLRLPPGLTPAGAAELLSRACDGAGQNLAMKNGLECFRGDKNTPLVRAFLSAIRAEGGKPGFLVKTGTSDMNVVGPLWNCPILAYGPGDSGLDHTPNEHISIREYQRSIHVLAEVLGLLQNP